MDKQNSGFALVLAHTNTIICPTTVETEMSTKKTNWVHVARYIRFATNQGNSDRDVVIRTTTCTRKQYTLRKYKAQIKEYKTVYSVTIGKNLEQKNDDSLTKQ